MYNHIFAAFFLDCFIPFVLICSLYSIHSFGVSTALFIQYVLQPATFSLPPLHLQKRSYFPQARSSHSLNQPPRLKQVLYNRLLQTNFVFQHHLIQFTVVPISAYSSITSNQKTMSCSQFSTFICRIGNKCLETIGLKSPKLEQKPLVIVRVTPPPELTASPSQQLLPTDGHQD